MMCHFIPARENFTAREVISSSSNDSPVSSPDRRRLNHSSDAPHHERLVHAPLARIDYREHFATPGRDLSASSSAQIVKPRAVVP
jgi:hypothetical protein